MSALSGRSLPPEGVSAILLYSSPGGRVLGWGKTRAAALELAEELAGEGAEFVKKGESIGYHGARGMVWLGA